MLAYTDDYDDNLLQQIEDDSVWPNLFRPEFLTELSVVADTIHKQNTIEGRLASVIIYHQITEEFIKVMIRYSVFVIQVAIWPTKYDFKFKDEMMFGQLLSIFKNTIYFNNKDSFIKECETLNKSRIDMVHNLTRKTSLSDVKTLTDNIQSNFYNIVKYYNESIEYYVEHLRDYKSNINWKSLSKVK
jgi:hypothetical protein